MQDLTNGRPDTTQIIIQVNNAASNDLSSPDQGLCAVSLKFRHPFVKELMIELISPAGQKISLTGGQMSPANTPFIIWDVTFIPCSASAAPDPGFKEIWENNQNWQSFTNYTGQYFPHIGCLEEFNSGTVNGNWTIRCIDYEDQGKGTLLDARLFFCDDSSIACSQCTLHPGNLPELNVSACQSDPSLKNLPITSLTPGQLKDSTHTYSYAFFRDSLYYTINERVDMDTFDVGSYTVCPIEVDSISKLLIPPDDQSISLLGVKQLIINQRLCAALSDSCMRIRISAAPDTIAVSRMICKGEEFQFFGQSFTESGEYFVSKNPQTCDSVFHLILKRPEEIVYLLKDKPQLSCANDTLSLTVNAPNPEYFLTGYNWTTVTGNILNTKDSLIELNAAGTYKASFTIYNQHQFCEDEIEIQIMAEGDDATYFIIPDSVTCQRDTAILRLNSMNGISSIRWSSLDAGSFVPLGSEIKVWQSARFLVEITNALGCVFRDTFELVSKKDTIIPELLVDTLTCQTKSAQIQILNANVQAAEFSGPDFFSNEISPVVSRAGIYSCKITSTNGCISRISFPVIADTIKPNVNIQGKKVLTCIDTSIVLEAVSDAPIATWMWSPTIAGSPTLSVNQPGEYSVFITGMNQCMSSASVSVVEDKPVPQFSAEATNINCKNLLSKVSVDTTGSVSNILWDDALNPSSILPGRFDFLTSISGVYHFLLINIQGCTANGAVEVISNKEPPKILQKIIDTLSCTKPAIVLGVVLNQDGMEYIWNGPGVYDVMTDSLLTVAQEGTYYLKITGSNYCVARTQFEVVRKGQIPVIQLEADSLTCTNPQTSIRLQSTESLAQFEWQGPSGFQSSLESPVVSIPGLYSLTAISRDSCIAIATVEVKGETDIPIISVRDTFFLPCNLSGALLKPDSLNPDLKYFWTGPDGTVIEKSLLKVFEPGLYTLVGESSLGCRSKSDSTFVLTDSGDLFFNVSFDTITCAQPFATISITDENPGQSYLWKSNSGFFSTGKTIQSNISGNYTLIVTDSDQCTDSLKFSIQADTLKPSVSVTQTGQIQCGNRQVSLEATPGLSTSNLLYTWSTNEGKILGSVNQALVQVEGAATYSLLLENQSNGCRTIATFAVREVAGGLTTAIFETSDPLCGASPDGSILLDNLNGTPPYC